jgi:hypothetical protein
MSTNAWHTHSTCRRLQLARHFQDQAVQAPCGKRCDVCRHPDPHAQIDVMGPVLLLLSALQQAESVLIALLPLPFEPPHQADPLGGGGHRRAAPAERRTAVKTWELWRAQWRAAHKAPPAALLGHGTLLLVLLRSNMSPHRLRRTRRLALTLTGRGRSGVAALPGAAVYTRDEAELLLVHLVIEGILREEFGHTLYTTVSYLLLGSRCMLRRVCVCVCIIMTMLTCPWCVFG